MKLPEGILVTGTFGCLGCPLRFITQEGEVEIAETHLTRFHVTCFDLTTRVSGKVPAEWSLVIAKFDQRDRGVGVTLEMGRLTDDPIH